MKFKRAVLALLVSVAFISVSAPAVSALSLIDEAKLYFYGLNGIYFYRLGGRGSDNCKSQGDNKNYAGVSVWSEAELAAIEENRAIYEEAGSAYGVPWQVLATIHSMESGLTRTNPSNGQGLYQLYSYTSGGSNGNAFTPGPVSEDEFRRQTEIAARVVSGMVGDLNDTDNIKRLFFKFNGASEKYIQKAMALGYTRAEAENGEGSAYVMNGYDAKRDPSSGEMDPAWAGRYVRDGVYDSSSTTRTFGAFVKYEALGGNPDCNEDVYDPNNPNNPGPSEFAGDIVAAAIALTWEGHGHSKNDPKPEYVEAMKSVGTYMAPCRSASDCAPKGASCDVFVATVMRYSGSDPNFPALSPTAQENYMASHPEMYSKVSVSDVSQLEPGDILVTTANGRHIYLNLGGGMQASASYNDRTGERFRGVYLSDGGTGGGRRYYTVYRRINS